MTKTCFKCSRVLVLSEFYRHSQMADGHLNKCKACTRADARAARRAKLDYYRAYDIARFHDDPVRRAQQYMASYALMGKYPERRRARSAVSNALRDGRLTRQPCEACGSLRSEAHHTDYARPLDVRWLCRLHHEAVLHAESA